MDKDASHSQDGARRNGVAHGRRESDRPAVVVPSRLPDPELERWIAEDSIDCHFQPQFDLVTGAVVGAEALARTRASISVDALFQRARGAGLAQRLSRQLQRRALRTVAAFPATFGQLGIAINLLPEDVGQHGFDDWLLTEIAAAALDPARITVEITENALICERGAVSDRLARLRRAGIRVAIDDFGTGYACLAYLSSLPLDSIKLDRAMVAAIDTCQRARRVVSAMVSLAHDLRLEVLAEGVESLAQLEVLRALGCNRYQGFARSKALSPQLFAYFIEGDKAA